MQQKNWTFSSRTAPKQWNCSITKSCGDAKLELFPGARPPDTTFTSWYDLTLALIVQTWTTWAVFFWVLGSYTTRAPTQVILPPKVQVFSKVRLICRAKSAFGTKMRACGPQSSSFLIAPTCAWGVFYRLKKRFRPRCPYRSSTGTISSDGDVAMTRRRCCPSPSPTLQCSNIGTR